MEDKEERILCLKVDYKPFVYLPNPRDYKVPEDIYKIIIGGSMTKQEAIEIMAKANWIAVVCAKNQLVPTGVSKEEWDAEWAKLRSDYKKVYYSGAKAALNALLEGGNK